MRKNGVAWSLIEPGHDKLWGDQVIEICKARPCHRFDARTRGRRSYAGAAGGVIPVRCNPHHQGIGEPPDDGPHSKQPARRNAW